ncbi:hypothetical protein [Nocardioides terrisoli]|nr:hypothetical protein [Nocardioides marmorisolisilvae]
MHGVAVAGAARADRSWSLLGGLSAHWTPYAGVDVVDEGGAAQRLGLRS